MVKSTAVKRFLYFITAVKGTNFKLNNTTSIVTRHIKVQLMFDVIGDKPEGVARGVCRV